MKLISREHLREFLNARDGVGTFAAASQYFRQKYPKASDQDVIIAQAVLMDYLPTVAIWDDRGRHDFRGLPLYEYARSVIEGTFGAFAQPEPSAAQSVAVFNLIETLIFSTRGERLKSFRADWIEQGTGEPSADPLTLTREAIALLNATKGAFKSKLVAQAKEKLQRVEVMLDDKAC